MSKRISGIALLAIVLWGSTMLAPAGHAQDASWHGVTQADQALTDDSLNKMLTDLGYEPKKLSKGYLITVKKDKFTFYVQFILSPDATKVGMNANLGSVEKPEEITAPQWLALLQSNAEIDPSSFYFDKEQKKLYLHRVIDNRGITNAILRQQTDYFLGNMADTADLWKFTK